MSHNIYIYIFVMAGVTYLIRLLPLTFIRGEIKNTYIRSFLYYVPYVTLSVMTFPAILSATRASGPPLQALLSRLSQPGVAAASSRFLRLPAWRYFFWN